MGWCGSESPIAKVYLLDIALIWRNCPRSGRSDMDAAGTAPMPDLPGWGHFLIIRAISSLSHAKNQGKSRVVCLYLYFLTITQPTDRSSYSSKYLLWVMTVQWAFSLNQSNDGKVRAGQTLQKYWPEFAVCSEKMDAIFV